MRRLPLALICASIVFVGGCARWEPQQVGPAKLTKACPLKRAPAVEEFAQEGMQGAYHFITQGVSESDLKALLQSARQHGFTFTPITININGKNTLIAKGPNVLMDQNQVDGEFALACSLGRGRAYLSHVRYNPAEEGSELLQVR